MLSALKAEPVTEAPTVRVVRVSNLAPALLEQWQALEERALEPNPFLSPLFVIPAVRHLRADSEVLILLIEEPQTDGTDGTTLVGLGVFESVAATRVLPLPHIKAYDASKMTFLTGLLVDRDHVTSVTDAFFEFLEGQPSAWQHVEFSLRTADSDLDHHLRASAARYGKTWHGEDFERAVLVPTDPALADALGCLSKKRRNNVRRGRRELQARGEVGFRVVRGCDVTPRQLDTFLELEHSGWKGDGGTSLLSTSATEAFFREMAAGFAVAGRILLAEISVDGQVVGSTTNLTAGRCAVAFKTGWNRDYAEVGLGVLQEVEFARQAPERLADLEYIDGGTGEDSWLLSLWPGRRRVTSGVFSGSRTSSAAYAVTRRLSAVKRGVRELRRRE